MISGVSIARWQVVVLLVVVGAVSSGHAEEWVNVTEKLYASLNTATMSNDGSKESPHARRTQGLLLDTTSGRVVLHVHKHGLYASTDHGNSWKPFGAAPVNGRGESGFPISAAQPFAGRFAVVTIDGVSAHTLDGGKSWTAWTKHRRGFDAADVDWASATPKTIFALNHEPYYRCVSTDGGKTWTDLESEAIPNQIGNKWRLGVCDAGTLLAGRCTEPGLSLSTNLGKTWVKVADFTPVGMTPIHYHTHLYWCAVEGVFCSENGKDWVRLEGSPQHAAWGPYFGKTEADMLVVSDRGFFVTADGGKTWEQAAPYFDAPDGFFHLRSGKFDGMTSGRYYGWDHANRFLYAGGMGGSLYRLKLK